MLAINRLMPSLLAQANSRITKDWALQGEIMNTMTRNRHSLLTLFFAFFILSLSAGCATPIRMQDSVEIVVGDSSIHFGDIDKTRTETRLGAEAWAAGDLAKAYKIFKKLAEQGDAGAQTNLGHLYLGDAKGIVPQDFAAALHWYSKAAAQHHANAHFSIGMLYLFGMGVPRDEVEAFRRIRTSAEQGYEYAQYFLGNAYAKGWGEVIGQDDAQAIYWMRRAAMQGNLDARRYLERKGK